MVLTPKEHGGVWRVILSQNEPIWLENQPSLWQALNNKTLCVRLSVAQNSICKLSF